MYFWRIEKLKTEMVACPLTEREMLPYLVVIAILTTVYCYVPTESSGPWYYVEAAYSILLTLFGTIYIYRQNGGSSGQHFLQRYLVLSWVVSIRCIALMILACAAMEITDVLADRMTWYECVVIAVIETVVYWRVGHHIRDIADRLQLI